MLTGRVGLTIIPTLLCLPVQPRLGVIPSSHGRQDRQEGKGGDFFRIFKLYFRGLSPINDRKKEKDYNFLPKFLCFS